MIKDFVPARTSLATGIVIKQHILERNRYKAPTVLTNTKVAKYGNGSSTYNTPLTLQNIVISGTVKPQWNSYKPGRIFEASGSTGGSFTKFNSINTSPYGSDGNGPRNIFNITQSWNETYTTPSGSVTVVHDSQDEFYNGEFSGSTLVVTTQNINPGCDPFKNINSKGIEYSGIRMYSSSGTQANPGYNFNQYISNDNHPTNGFISIWYALPEDSLPPQAPEIINKDE